MALKIKTYSQPALRCAISLIRPEPGDVLKQAQAKRLAVYIQKALDGFKYETLIDVSHESPATAPALEARPDAQASPA